MWTWSRESIPLDLKNHLYSTRLPCIADYNGRSLACTEAESIGREERHGVNIGNMGLDEWCP